MLPFPSPVLRHNLFPGLGGMSNFTAERNQMSRNFTEDYLSIKVMLIVMQALSVEFRVALPWELCADDLVVDS